MAIRAAAWAPAAATDSCSPNAASRITLSFVRHTPCNRDSRRDSAALCSRRVASECFSWSEATVTKHAHACSWRTPYLFKFRILCCKPVHNIQQSRSGSRGCIINASSARPCGRDACNNIPIQFCSQFLNISQGIVHGSGGFGQRGTHTPDQELPQNLSERLLQLRLHLLRITRTLLFQRSCLEVHGNPTASGLEVLRLRLEIGADHGQCRRCLPHKRSECGWMQHGGNVQSGRKQQPAGPRSSIPLPRRRQARPRQTAYKLSLNVVAL